MRLPWMLFPDHQQTKLLEEEVYSLAWSPNGQYLALGCSSQFTIVDPLRGSVLTRVPIAERYYSSIIVSLAWSPNGKMLALTTGHARCFFYDVAHKVQTPPVLSYSSDAWSDRFTFVHGWIGHQKSIAVASQEHSLMIIDPVSKIVSAVSTAFEIPRPSCAVSPSGRWVALANHIKGAEVALYTVGRADPRLLKVNIYQPEPVYQPDHLLPPNENNEDRDEDERWYVLPPSLVAWSQDGTHIATSFGSRKKRIYIWETTTGMTRHVLEAPTQQEEALSLAWGPDGCLAWGGRGYLQISQLLSSSSNS
jgi:WD40 repeat protein